MSFFLSHITAANTHSSFSYMCGQADVYGLESVGHHRHRVVYHCDY